MKDYLYYLFDEKLSGDDLSTVKEQICATGAKVVDLSPSEKNIRKRLKELKGKKKYALVVGNSVETQRAAMKAKVQFCGWLDGTTPEQSLKTLPYRQLLKDIKLLPLLSQPYPYYLYNRLTRHIRKYTRWVHFKQIRGVSHKPKHSIVQHVCINCGETYEGNFCPTCGQSNKTERFDLKNLLKNFLSEAINIEHGFLRNFLELFWRPGYMMRDYLAGRRKDYHKPFQTLFVMTTIYLITAHLLDPASFVKQKKEPNLEEIPEIVQKMTTDSLNAEVIPQLNTINKLANEIIAIKRKYNTEMALEMADSILKSQHSGIFMSTKDSILLMSQVEAGMSRADSVKLSIVLLDNLNDNNSIWATLAKMAARNAAVVEKFKEKYYHEGTILYSMGELVIGFFDMNKAVSIIMIIPILVFCTRRSFRYTLVNMRTNLAEYIIVFTIFGGQILWLQFFTLLGTQTSDFTPGFDLGAGMAVMIWDMKQFFNLGWKETMKRCLIYMSANTIVFVFFITGFISIFTSIFMWVLYQFT